MLVTTDSMSTNCTYELEIIRCFKVIKTEKVARGFARFVWAPDPEEIAA